MYCRFLFFIVVSYFLLASKALFFIVPFGGGLIKNKKPYFLLSLFIFYCPGHPKGGSSKSLFPLVFESWADLGTPGVPPPKMVPRASLREPKVAQMASGGYFLKLFDLDF